MPGVLIGHERCRQLQASCSIENTEDLRTALAGNVDLPAHAVVDDAKYLGRAARFRAGYLAWNWEEDKKSLRCGKRDPMMSVRRQRPPNILRPSLRCI